MSDQPNTPEPVEGDAAQTPPEGGEAKTFDETYVKKLRDEAAKYRTEAKANAEAAARLKEFEDRDKTEAEKAAGRLTAAEQRAAEAESRALRLDVAFEKGLTPAQAKRLVGTSREDLEADADEILRDFPVKPARPSGDIAQGARTPAQLTDPRARDLAPIDQDLKARARR